MVHLFFFFRQTCQRTQKNTQMVHFFQTNLSEYTEKKSTGAFFFPDKLPVHIFKTKQPLQFLQRAVSTFLLVSVLFKDVQQFWGKNHWKTWTCFAIVVLSKKIYMYTVHDNTYLQRCGEYQQKTKVWKYKKLPCSSLLSCFSRSLCQYEYGVNSLLAKAETKLSITGGLYGVRRYTSFRGGGDRTRVECSCAVWKNNIRLKNFVWNVNNFFLKKVIFFSDKLSKLKAG